ncbi:MAG: RNase H family protein [Candidatus Marinimicrobia bacterium]|nr:RNase H family protein [Candidatus Neomarinimicrobiota bacterium]
MPLYKKETQKKANQFNKKLKNNGFNSKIDLDSYRDYLVKLIIFYKEKYLGKASIYYSSKKNSYKLVTNEIQAENFKEEIEELWSEKREKAKTKISNSNIPHIYIDGSFLKNMISYAAVVVKNDKNIHEESGKLDKKYNKYRQIGGELYAAKTAIEWCKKNKLDNAIIYYDYTGIEKWATGKWKTNNSFTRSYKNYMSKIEVNIKWIKIKSHSGDKWNEYVDQLAKDEILK